MAAGLGALRLTPDAFWSMTPRELSAALGLATASRDDNGPPDRDALSRLMQMYPDRRGDDHG